MLHSCTRLAIRSRATVPRAMNSFIASTPDPSPVRRFTTSPARTGATTTTTPVSSTNGDLNNTSAARQAIHITTDEAYLDRSLAIPESEDDPDVRRTYRPFLPTVVSAQEAGTGRDGKDWVAELELSTTLKMAEQDLLSTGQRVKILVLYGSLRARSFSKLLAFEASRILFRLGCDVRVYDPRGLPVKDDVQHDHPKVQELRSLSRWSDGHVWISPEQHGNLTAVFKNQIDWIPLSTGSVRPTQGRTLAVAQVSGGSQSFNSVNSLRILGRWMRMFTIPNQSSVPMAYTQFTDAGTEADTHEQALGRNRMLPSGNRNRLVDCMEELVKYTIVMRPHFDLFGDRFSERVERREKERKAQLARRAEEEEKVKQKEGDHVNGVNISSI